MSRVYKQLSSYYRGFTLLELLIVIAIVGLLAAIVLHSVIQARKRADAVGMIKQVQEIEKALQVFVLSENKTSWVAYTGNPFHQYTIDRLTSNSPPNSWFNGFNRYFSGSSVPRPPAGGSYIYVNRGQTVTCGMNSNEHNYGVSIRIGGASNFPNVNQQYLEELFEIANEIIDGDGNGEMGRRCGRLRMGGPSSSVYYLIANNSGDI